MAIHRGNPGERGGSNGISSSSYARGRVTFKEISSNSRPRDPELPFGCAAKSNSCDFSLVRWYNLSSYNALAERSKEANFRCNFKLLVDFQESDKYLQRTRAHVHISDLR